jgi:hypothetical protein
VYGWVLAVRRRSVFLPLVFLAAGFVSCAGAKEGRTHLPDGSYQLACSKPLGDCLNELADVCSAHGYDVLKANEQTRRYGIEPVDSTVIESEAVIRCRAAKTIFGAAEPSAKPVASSVHPGSCFPGSTQGCLGPGACHGAQTCQSDGARFGACDCGVPNPAPAPVEAGDAGPPPTWAVPPDGAAPP